ncbi:Di-copper centre-containing protein [Tuber magnatum]|uniref:tyrosinase n=1 Tax=Tuber magnatum TaxID=42249 RepID=A0A317SGF7_9PEZI|nr:Di-copper centre-containing protein [Tuber magnatum]
MPILNGIEDNEPKTSELWEDPNNPVGAPGNAKWAGAESLEEPAAYSGGYNDASTVPPGIKKFATKVEGSETKPTWDDHIAGLFAKPFWIPQGTKRDRAAARWVEAMKGYMIDLESYESVKHRAAAIYYHLRGRSTPLPGELGEQEYFPKEACELIRLWINQGTRKTSDDKIEPREEEIKDIDEAEWDIAKARKDILELTQEELDYYRMQLDDVLRAGDPDGNSPWQKLGSIHTEWCLHHQEAFLPWHRAHLLYMESMISCPIPYWNFFAKGADEYGNPSAGIPQAFLDEEYKHPLTGLMRPNPLKYSCANGGMSKAAVSPGHRDVLKDTKSKRYVQRDPLLTGGGTEEERREKIAQVKLYQDQILNALTQPIFSQPQGLYGYPWANNQSSDPPPSDDQYPNGGDFDALLEKSNDNFHEWIGPDMADNSYTAFDPIFWSYHANLDRIFEQYIHSHQDATFSSIFPLQPFTGSRADSVSLGDPRKHIYTTIGDMAKTSLALGYSIASPVHQDCPPKPVTQGREDPTAGSKTPYVLFEGVTCTTKSYTIDVYIASQDTSGPAAAPKKHFVGRLTRTGTSASASTGGNIKQGVARVLNAAEAAEYLVIRDDAAPVLSQVVTDIETGERVPEEVYKEWDGFVGRLIWGAATP